MGNLSGRPLALAALALLAGVALGASALDGGGFAVAVLAVPAAYLTVEASGPRGGAAARTGFAFGVGFALVTTAFVPTAYARTGGSGAVGWALYGAVVLLQAIAPAIGAGCYRLASRGPSPAWFAAAMATAFAATPMVFPWSPAAMALELAPVAHTFRLAGAFAADFVLAFVTVALVPWPRFSRLRFAIALAVVGAAWVHSSALIRQVTSEAAKGPRVRVGVVQPAVTLAEGLDRRADDARLARLRAATQTFAGREADTIVWPESAHPFGYFRGADRDHASPRDTGGATVGVHVVVGAQTYDGYCLRWNGAVAMDPRGRRVGMVDKRRRMPFGDYIPLLERVSRGVACRSLRPAREAGPLTAVPGRPGVLVCYDEVEPGPARDQARAGAGYLVAMNNDAWYEGTRQPALQALHVRMRAIETGRDVIRSGNLGGSFHVLPTGRIVDRLPEGRPATAVHDVPIRGGTTLATRLGSWPVVLATLGLIVRAAWVRRASRVP